MSPFIRSEEDIQSLRDGILILSNAERNRITSILNDIGINLDEINDKNFQVLQEYVNNCLLEMRKKLETDDLGRDLMKLPGKFLSNFNFLKLDFPIIVVDILPK